MSGRKDDRPEKLPSIMGPNAFHLVPADDEFIHPRLKMHLPTMFQNRVAHGFYDSRKLVRTDMRMRICQNRDIRPVLTEDGQYPLHTAPLLAACIKLSVGIRPGASFTKSII